MRHLFLLGDNYIQLVPSTVSCMCFFSIFFFFNLTQWSNLISQKVEACFCNFHLLLIFQWRKLCNEFSFNHIKILSEHTCDCMFTVVIHVGRNNRKESYRKIETLGRKWGITRRVKICTDIFEVSVLLEILLSDFCGFCWS